jgi:uncharacterized membrane protein YeiB
LCGLVAIPLALLALGVAVFRARAAKVLSLVSLVLSLLPFLVGFLGQQRGRARVEQALDTPAIDAATRAAIRAEGNLEADQCIAIGGTLSALPTLLSLAAVLAALLLRRRENGEGRGDSLPLG